MLTVAKTTMSHFHISVSAPVQQRTSNIVNQTDFELLEGEFFF